MWDRGGGILFIALFQLRFSMYSRVHTAYSLGLVLNTDFGLIVHRSSSEQVTSNGFSVSLGGSFHRRKFLTNTEGLCGVYDNDPSNDFTMPSGEETEDETEFGMSWIHPGLEVKDSMGNSCEKKVPLAGCKDDADRKKAAKLCQPIKATEGPLTGCLNVPHYSAAIHALFHSCVFDVCTMEFSKEALCDSIASAVATCQSNPRVSVAVDWRRADYCAMTCPKNMQYKNCAPAHLKSCSLRIANPGPTCVEGCQCKNPKHLYDPVLGDCVATGGCGCLDENKSYRARNESWLTSSCDNLCECKGKGIVECHSNECHKHGHCDLDKSSGEHVCQCPHGLVEGTEGLTPTCKPKGFNIAPVAGGLGATCTVAGAAFVVKKFLL